MEIRRLRLQNFKRHAELDLEFAPGLNIVRGPNEAGKTTVQRALELALFRRPTSSSQDLDDARPWTDAEADPEIEIEFDEDGVRGSMRKQFAGQRGTVELRVGDDVFTDPAAVEAQVARLTGLPSEKFFRATASVHHQELVGLAQDETTLRDRLQQSMSGADRGTYTARRKLDDAIRRYRSEGAKNPGYLKVHRSDVERLREQVRRGELALQQLERDRQVLAEGRARRIDLDAQLTQQRAGVEKAERAAALTAQITDAARRYAVYKRAAELRDEIGRLEASHPSRVDLTTLRSAVEHLRNLEFDISEKRAELAAEPDLSGYDVAIQAPRWRPWAAVAIILSILAVAALGAGAVAGQIVFGLVGAVVLGAGAGYTGWTSMKHHRRLSDIRMQNELRESEIARRLSGRTDLSERVRQTEQERAEALATLGLADLPRAETTLAAETDHVAQIGSRKAEYRGLLGDDPSDEDVGLLRDQAAAEGDECKHALAGMGELGRDPERHLAIYHLAVQRLTPEREAALHTEAQADARVAANEVDAEAVAADAEALEDAQEALASSERRLRIYEDVLGTLNGAERATMKKAARFLEQRMARDIERITGGRYRRLRVDEATLTFMVFSPEINDWVDVRKLSQGTLDQLYLCARLGIVRQVTQPASPPLVFDDPFVTFDDQRAKRAVSLLKDIARDHQVIYLTTSNRYDSMADKVIELPTPTAKDEPEPVVATSGPAETLSVWSNAVLAPAEPKIVPTNGNGHAPTQPAPMRQPAGSTVPVVPIPPTTAVAPTSADSAATKALQPSPAAPARPAPTAAPEPTPLWPVEERESV
ncbi:MAG: AAA family ATPase [Candidatus Limnocylindrales bacterium]